MEEFKIELFKSEHKIDFPHYVSLSKEKCLILVNRLSGKYKFSKIDSLIKLLYSNKELLLNIDDCKEFKFIDILNSLKIIPLTNVYINWYRFDAINIFITDDVDKYFFNIWFPTSDDIDIFDESLDWIVSVRHDGCVSFLKYNSSFIAE
jgi:hypothetical protein